MNDIITSKVLIIDDETAILKMVSKVLSRKGYCVEIAENGEEGINKIESNDYNLILTDIKMPGISGEQVADTLKNIKDRRTPIVGMSGTPWLLDEDIFDAVISKPCASDELLKVINQIVKNPGPKDQAFGLLPPEGD